MEIEKVAKSRKLYSCILCDYSTCNKTDYSKHLSTQKHQANHDGNEYCKKVAKKIICCCEKEFITTAGLWKHRKVCELYNKNINSIIAKEIKEDIVIENNNKNSESDIKALTNLVLTVVEQNKELTNQLIELSKNAGNTTNNINSYNNNNNNNNFNLNIFLNETCKDAINMSDFINSLNVSVEDLEETGAIGYADGVSSVFINGLNELDTHNRPIHCADFRREILYIKDDNKWYKESDTKSKLLQAIKMITKKHISTIFEWQKLHPEYNDPDSKQNDRYQQIILSSMPGSTIEESNKNYDKIIRRLAKASIIKKK
uniref:C2H2-type domain-containing protein n=1 Tax=viral metagenome TaxID=1070528 RepID=A0A6C0IVS6_9ZZZZ